MPELRNASDTKPVVSGTITVYLSMKEPNTRVTIVVVDKLAILVLLETIFIDRFIMSIHPTERKIIPHHSPPIPSLLIHETKSAAENHSYDIGQFRKQDPALLGMPTSN